MATSSIAEKTVLLLDRVYKYTEYENQQDAEDIYGHLRAEVLRVSGTSQGQKLTEKFSMLAGTVADQGGFKDMVKIIWRMVKPMPGNPYHKLCLFLLAVTSTHESLKSSSMVKGVDQWIEQVERWLGKQLTIGGKGVTGEGEGSVTDRIQRFFSTPYLHDFD